MIKVEFNAADVFAQLDRARAQLDDMKPVYDDVAEYMVQATKDRFRNGKGPDGTRWRKKQPSTLAAYLARGDGDRPDPLIGPSGRLGREIVSLVTKDSAEIGSNLEYSAVMQDGARKGAFGTTKSKIFDGDISIPWGDIPARPWLGISADDERNIIDIVDEHLGEALGT